MCQVAMLMGGACVKAYGAPKKCLGRLKVKSSFGSIKGVVPDICYWISALVLLKDLDGIANIMGKYKGDAKHFS